MPARAATFLMDKKQVAQSVCSNADRTNRLAECEANRVRAVCMSEVNKIYTP